MSRRCRRRLAGRTVLRSRRASTTGPADCICEKYSLTAWPDIACRRPQRVLKILGGLIKKYSVPESLRAACTPSGRSGAHYARVPRLQQAPGAFCGYGWREERVARQGGTVSVRPAFQRAGCLRRNRHWREALRASPMDGGAPRQSASVFVAICGAVGPGSKYLLQCCGAEVRPGPNQASCKSQLANNVLPSCAWRSAGRLCNAPHVGRGAGRVGSRSVSIRRCPEA